MTLRVAATSLFSVFVFIVLAMATGLISANVRKLADRYGWDNLLVRGAEKLRWERVRGLWWLWSISGLSGGVALALWLSPILAPVIPVTQEGSGEIATFRSRLAIATQENENLKRELETIRQAANPVASPPVASSPTADRPKAYTLFDLENRQKALDEFDNCLNTKALNAFTYGSNLYDSWYQAKIDLTKFSAGISEFRKLLISEMDEMAALSQKYRQKYPDIESVGVLIDENLIGKTDMLRNELNRLASLSPNGNAK
jgi:hypothetical protein